MKLELLPLADMSCRTLFIKTKATKSNPSTHQPLQLQLMSHYTSVLWRGAAPQGTALSHSEEQDSFQLGQSTEIACG